MLPLVPIFDDITSLTKVPDASTLLVILVSCVLGFLVNLSIFLVIGSTSAITYNVLGHFKLISILIAGFTLFGVVPTWFSVSGSALAIAGVAWYTNLKSKGNEPKQQPPLSINTEEENVPTSPAIDERVIERKEKKE